MHTPFQKTQNHFQTARTIFQTAGTAFPKMLLCFLKWCACVSTEAMRTISKAPSDPSANGVTEYGLAMGSLSHEADKVWNDIPP